MKFGSVCSGIEAASVAWHPLGWQAVWLSEIEPFPCAVLAHRHPDVPNLGDMRTIAERVLSSEIEAPDVFTGGTPCQSFSVAGKRQSLDDARGNLSLTFCEIADAIDAVRVPRGDEPCIIVWENVPGVLSTKDNAFGCFLGQLAGEDCALEPPRGKWSDAGCVLGPTRAIAWRVLDAQYFGLAQRRRRVFVVASARTGFDPAAVLFEFDGVRRDSPPSREPRQVAPTIPSRSFGGGGLGTETDFDCDGGLIASNPPATAFHPTQDPISSSGGSTHALGCGSSDGQVSIAVHCVTGDVFHTLRSEGFDASEDGTGRGTGVIAIRTAQTGSNGWGINTQGTAYTLDGAQQAVAIALRGRDAGATSGLGDDCTSAMTAGTNSGNALMVLTSNILRRITPRECERLQGFDDDYTVIPWRGKPAELCPDGPRYKAIGNSWAVPVVRWIGARIKSTAQAVAGGV
ncbi:MAG: putative BsuMI modification methylase subunit YdiP [Dehalococcoidia bacterium]|nr:putative BsuMI modification methylase subunit YdiP [Chloroflexota bacterium]